MKNTSDKKLNPQQKQAVEFGKGPLLIIAGAGTGKTTVITERIKYLISKELAKPSEILALTFTEKASREMEMRVDEAMPYGYTQMWISTFHSFCDRILRAEAVHIGLDPGYKLLGDADSTMILREHLFELNLEYFRPLGNPGKFIRGMLQHFGRLADEDVRPIQYIDWIRIQNSMTKTQKNEEKLLELKKYQELATAYKYYSDLKVKEGYMDFSDLITNALVLFRTRKNILRKYQEQFKFILIDEFQDTNIAQYELIKLLAPPLRTGGPNLTVVGDDNQSVYKFRGAAISNILYFKEDYKKAKQVILNKNYRSYQNILDHAYKLIKHNDPDTLETKLGISKELVAVRKTTAEVKVEFIHADRVENEAEKVARVILSEAKDPERLTVGLRDSSSAEPAQNDINKVQNDKSYKWSDFVILVRANNHAEPFVRALSRQGIPYQFLGPGQLYRQPEIKELIAYLQVLNDITNDQALYKVLSMEFFDISSRDLALLISYGKRNLLSLFEVCEIVASHHEPALLVKNPGVNSEILRAGHLRMTLLPNISQNSQEKITQIIDMLLKHLTLVKKDSAGQILFYFLENSGMLKNILEYKTPIDEHQANNITKFFNKLKTYEAEHEDASVTAALDFIMMSMELGESPTASDTDWTENNAVNILTVHSSKGLEFPVVFLVNMVSQRFPSLERKEQIPIPDELIKEVLPEGDFHEEEERRLFYVGMTRARDSLFLTAANYYGEGKREKKLSPFILEALGREYKLTDNTAETSQLSLLDWQSFDTVYSEQGRTAQDKIVKKVKSKTDVNFLSYSQIETFKTCPLHYKLRYLLKIPTPPSPALSFGITIHSVLKKIYQTLKQGNDINKKMALEFLEKNWIRDGYGSKKYESLMKKRGENYLHEYLKKEFNPRTKTLMLEENFVFPIKNNIIPASFCHSRARLPTLERSDCGQESGNLEDPRVKSEDDKYRRDDRRTLRIGGKIDRVDDLGNGMIEIIDYKTGRVPSKREIDRDLQMSIYALAATEIKDRVFDKKPDQVKLTFYYFDTQEKISTVRTKEQLETEKINLLKIAADIEASDFKCSGSQICEFCEYKLWCGVSG